MRWVLPSIHRTTTTFSDVINFRGNFQGNLLASQQTAQNTHFFSFFWKKCKYRKSYSLKYSLLYNLFFYPKHTQKKIKDIGGVYFVAMGYAVKFTNNTWDNYKAWLINFLGNLLGGLLACIKPHSVSK